jgi:vancomycin resistance protein VanW
MILRALVRRLVPLSLRQDIRQLWRTHMDDWRGLRFKRERGEIVSPRLIRLAQPIRQTSLYQNKLTNLRRAAALLDGQLIAPGANWSFWHAIGRPDACNGFVAGRNLVGGRLVEQTGGGLCQMASLVYHLALLAGLGIRERHAHSVDIYREEERFTPLGADATVVWGFKDLRLTNSHEFPVVLRVRVVDGEFGGELCGECHAQGTLAGRSVEFVREAFAPEQVRVHTLAGGVVLEVTEYRQMPGVLAVQPAFV